MSKLHAPHVTGKDPGIPFALPEQVEVPLHQLAGAVKEGLLAFSVGIGLQVMQLMMDEELNDVVGPKGKHDESRTATRHGSENGSVVLGGRKTSVTRPRARYLNGSGEVELQTYKHFSTEDLLGEMALERMVAGLSTRNYGAGLEPVGDVDATGTKRSSVSRRFVERTTTALKELMARDLSELTVVALLLDGVEIAGHTMIVALGIDAKGHKHPLGMREGTTENKGVGRALLSNLIERGLEFDDGILVVNDGGKGLRAAVNSVFGRLALVQRCQLHKRRNVIDHLPDHMHSFVAKKMERAYKMRDFGAAKRSLQDLAKTLDAQHPGAAASLREGLEETLTVVRLGLSPSLQRTLRSTNTIESMISMGRTTMRNVKRWRDAKMVERWTAAGMLEAEKRFYRAQGYRDIPALQAALRSCLREVIGSQEEAA
ncbi:IS256-like element ISRba9 family transposase [soil metagenome]